jgi:hypothetical protein
LSNALDDLEELYQRRTTLGSTLFDLDTLHKQCAQEVFALWVNGRINADQYTYHQSRVLYKVKAILNALLQERGDG